MQLAINLPDLSRVPKLIFNVLLADKLDRTSTVQADKNRADEIGVCFTCDQVTAAAACDILREKDRQLKRYPTRIYLQKRTAWSRLVNAAILSDIVGGELQLNPAIFG